MKNSMHLLKQVLLGTLAMQLLNSTVAAAPLVNWVRPTNGAAFAAGSRILLTATAINTNGTLSIVDFLVGTNLVRRFSGTLTNGTYTASWSNAPAGTFDLHS